MQAETIFLAAMGVLAYTYFGYPALVWFGSRLVRRRSSLEQVEPRVDVLLSLYNEEESVEARIRNFLALDYPPKRLRLLVGTDGCSDRTAAAVRDYVSSRVHLIEQCERRGKTAMLNRLAAESDAEVLVFTDADSMFSPDAIRRLVDSFADPAVGLVTGRTAYVSSTGDAEEVRGMYVRFENLVKSAESRLGGVVGADGAIYALRRSLFEPIPEKFINDFYHPIQVVVQGFRAVYQPKAVCREVAVESVKSEYHRQTRISSQSLLIFVNEAPRLLIRGRWVYLIFLTSHKFLRWLTLPPVVALAGSSAMLAADNTLALLVFCGIMAWLLVALLGLGWPAVARNRWVDLASNFLIVNLAFLQGMVRLLRGNVFITWEPRGS